MQKVEFFKQTPREVAPQKKPSEKTKQNSNKKDNELFQYFVSREHIYFEFKGTEN